MSDLIAWAAAHAAPPALLAAASRAEAALAEALAVTVEHRLCGPVYEGCYAHFTWPHCRADGMAWPCDVEAIRIVLAAHGAEEERE